MESNGSTSMAIGCGGSLALMDAGVPMTRPVAGISIGLCTEHDDQDKIARYKLLTDIIGWEDAFCDMDCKLAGTEKGITGFQLDLKLRGIPLTLMTEAVEKARVARLFILAEMAKTLAAAAQRNQQVRAAHRNDQDQPGENRRPHRPRRQEHQEARRGIRLRDQHRGRRHRQHLLGLRGRHEDRPRRDHRA